MIVATRARPRREEARFVLHIPGEALDARAATVECARPAALNRSDGVGMSEREAFIEAIAANPGESAARLAFADWLQEHGEEERAEFVRRSHELLARLSEVAWAPPFPADVLGAQERVRELFESHGAGWLEPFCRALGTKEPVPVRRKRWLSRLWLRVATGAADRMFGGPRRLRGSLDDFRFGHARVEGWPRGPVKSLDVHHGLVTQLEIDLGSPLPIRDAGAAFRLEPVNRLSVRIADAPDQWRRLNAPCLARVTSLTVEVGGDHATGAAETFEKIGRGENWSGVDDFHLRGDFLRPVPHEYVERLARSPLLPGLRSLSVTTDFPDLRPLAASPLLSDLQTFGVWGHRLPDDAADVIGRAAFRPNLEELDLSMTHLGNDGAERLAAVAWPKLRALEFGFNELSDAGVRSLLPLVPQLSGLGLAGNALTDTGALVLADAIDPEKLESLWLSYNPLSPRAVAALRDRFGPRFHFRSREEDGL
ncbi:MAG: TIGR02996 domain-containing protein [Planctomycetes bacterium]|nr:TIGR02996 domain-containing protein [Planctomycetota bacterium]